MKKKTSKVKKVVEKRKAKRAVRGDETMEIPKEKMKGDMHMKRDHMGKRMII